MLAWFRKLLANWVARVFFGALLVVFVFWGISNVVTLISASTTIAHVAGKPIDISVVQAEYQTELNQAEQKGTPDLAERQQIAQAAMATVLRQQALAAAEQQLGIVVPDSAVRAQIDAVPQFQTNGAFDEQKFDQVLQQNSLTPDKFISDIKQNLANGQLVQALTAGVAPPTPLAAQIFSYIAQARIAETVAVTTAAQAAPAAPSDATLQRYWKNNPQKYTAPEYRTIKLVVLSPAVLAPTEPVSAAELQAAYAHVAATETVPASRSVQVVTGSDEAKLKQIAADWRSGASWAAVQAEAAKDHASAVELDHAQADQFPSPALSAAVFAATPGVVTGPVAGGAGYFVLDVTDAVQAGAPSLASVSAQLKQQIQLQKATQAVNQDVDNVQDALAGQTPLDRLPGDLGLAAVQGTLDSNGETPAGNKAPIPDGAKLGDAVVKAVFAAHVGDPPQLVSGPDNSYFAFTIDRIIPPAQKPFDQVEAQVAADWQADQLSREAEAKAAALLQAVNSGKTLDQAASAAGLSVTASAPISRGAPPAGVSQDFVNVLFSLKPGQATMTQTADGFQVAVLTKILQPRESDQPQLLTSIDTSLTKGLQSDVLESFLNGLQTREHVTVEPKLLAQIYQ
jgi:peptidyl-prolyl cis-trans isomerase D